MHSAARPSQARLNGWKEIAAHFGRTIRTVQRWEQELGLPVHRLSTGKGETVYALIGELESWLADNERIASEGRGNAEGQASRAGGERTGSREEATPTPREVPEPPAPHRAHRTLATILSGILLVVAVAALLLGTLQNRPDGETRPVASAYRRQGNELTVLDQGGLTRWRWKAPFELNENAYQSQQDNRLKEAVLFADLEGDGRVETLFTAVGMQFSDSVLYVFEEDGRLRFAWKYEGQKRFGDLTCSPPWVVRQTLLRRPAAGGVEIWITIVHAPWFPSALIRLDANGRITGEFWHPGHITRVVPSTLGGRGVLLVGAGTNEFRAGALAVVDPAVSTTAPTLDDKYACRDCPSDRPLRYLVFPRTTISREFDPVAMISWIAVDAVGQTVVTVEQLGVQLSQGTAPLVAETHYVFDKMLAPLSAEFGDTYIRTYRGFEAEGRFTRPLRRDDQSELWPIREWDGSAFAPLPVPR